MSGDRDYLPSDRAARLHPAAGERRSGQPQALHAGGSDDHGFPAMTATLASPGSPKADYDATAIKLPPDPPRDPKQKNTWRWSADMALTGPQTILTQQLGNNGTDTLDYLAFWKTFDIAAEAAFAGKDAAALLRDPKFIDMGTWSDGWPVRRLSAQMPKVEGQENKPEPGPRRRLNMAPAGNQAGIVRLSHQVAFVRVASCVSIFWRERPIIPPSCRLPFPPSSSSIPASAASRSSPRS